MRSIQWIALALLATSASADTISNVSVSAFVEQDPLGQGSRVPGCGGDATGTTSASITFACDFIATETQVHELYSGFSEAETGVGPYGIGASVDLQAGGNNSESEPTRVAVASASFSWSQDDIVRGAQGNGAAIVTLHELQGNIFDAISLELFNKEITGRGDFIIIPITFGVLYTNTMSGTTGLCLALFIREQCGVDDIFVSGLSFTDADGNPLPDAVLVNVLELSSWLLLATCAVSIAVWRRHGGRQARGVRVGDL